ncbi:hypothetical protein SDC9_87084 [bioreactor metagenome]|uniref:Peptidase S9 prolyl oligopeptidase catalytic domain-containing protein n=1 Tax=bioreactor metagenome TaxID=1076179 RepID=A0A644ZP23_9ZZZZ
MKEFCLSGDGNIVVSAVFEGSRPNLSELSGKEQEDAMRKVKEGKDIQVIDELPWWSNGAGFTNKRRTRLYLFNTATKTVTAVTDPLFQVTGFRLSPCRGYLVYFGFEFLHTEEKMTGLYLYSLATGESRTLLAPVYAIAQADFLNDSTIIFSGSDQKTYGFYTNPWFYTVEIGSGKLAVLAEYDCNVSNVILADCRLGGGITFKTYEGSLFFTGVVNHDCYLNKLDANGEITHVVQEEGGVDCFDVGQKGIIFIGMMGQRLQELYFFDKERNGITRITSFNEELYTNYYVAKPQPLSFTETDGFTIDGWVLLPFEYEPQKKYPAILFIHGGPKGAFGTVFFNDLQYLAGQGYFVLFCNPRGSEGKGNAFAAIRGNYGTFDYDNLMQFVDLCIEKYPAIDSGRLGVTGGSYGGFMTNWIIGHTDRFKAAVSERSIASWISFIGLSDIGISFGEDQMDANIWSGPEKIWRQSPLRYADKAKTPTLFIHSDQDYRCCIPEGYQMFTALKRFGVETRMCVFRGECHDLSRSGKPIHRVRRLQEIAKWFDDRLK